MHTRRSILVRVSGGCALPLLLAGTAICLIKYAGWSAVTSAYYGLPSHAQVVTRASHAATAWGSGLIGLGFVAIVLTFVLVPFPSERLSPGLRGTIRIMVALVVVAAGTASIGELLVTIGHHLH
jgi:hypothetical protein